MITVNIYYRGENGSARAFAEGHAYSIRQNPGKHYARAIRSGDGSNGRKNGSSGSNGSASNGRKNGFSNTNGNSGKNSAGGRGGDVI